MSEPTINPADIVLPVAMAWRFCDHNRVDLSLDLVSGELVIDRPRDKPGLGFFAKANRYGLTAVLLWSAMREPMSGVRCEA